MKAGAQGPVPKGYGSMKDDPMTAHLSAALAEQARPALDRLELRLEIGKAVRAMREAHTKAFSDPEAEAECDRLHDAWRKLQDQMIEAERAYDAARRRRAYGNQRETQEVVRLEKATPGLMLMSDEYLPEGSPRVIVCAVTGLAIFEGDEIIGREDYGFVALKAAIETKPGIPSLGADPTDEGKI